MNLSDVEKLVADRLKKEGWKLEPYKDLGKVVEELGEVAREMRRYDDGRERPDEVTPPKEEIRRDMAAEVGDALFALIKITMHYGITLEEAVITHQEKMDKRYK